MPLSCDPDLRFNMDQTVLTVKWLKDGSINTVVARDLWYRKTGQFKKGMRVQMRDERGRWWAGKVISILPSLFIDGATDRNGDKCPANDECPPGDDDNIPPMELPSEGDDATDSNDCPANDECPPGPSNLSPDIDSCSGDDEDNIPLTELMSKGNNEIQPDQATMEAHCMHNGCREEVFAACVTCLSLLCGKHFFEDDPCNQHIEMLNDPQLARLVETIQAEDIDLATSNTIVDLQDDGSQPSVPSQPSEPAQPSMTSQDFTPPFPNMMPVYAYHSVDSNVDTEADPLQMTPKQCENTKARKRVANPEQWKQNTQRKRRNLGLAYTSRDGKERPARKMGEGCETDCRYRCCDHISKDQREELFLQYWAIGDAQRRSDFIRSHVSMKKSKKENRRRVQRNYSLPVEGKAQKVCQKYFLHTLGETQKVVLYSTGRKDHFPTDRRGKHSPKNKSDEKDLDKIRSHIKKFYVVPSHYCRSSTSRQYLPGNLSIRKMYDLYKQETPNPKCLNVYRRIFNTEFNLGFHMPKKDECKECTTFRNASPEAKEILRADHEEHVRNKIRSREEKEKDKQKAMKDSTYHSYSFDLQQVLPCPSGNASLFFYKRKLSTYNLSLYSQGSGEGFCYLWSEEKGRRGASEVGSCLLRHLRQLSGVKHVSLFSDSCGGQNRNRFVAAALLHAVRTTEIETIEHKFLEPGHTQMEVDSIHSTIETAKKNIPVYHPDQWATVVALARRKKPYHVTQIQHHEFFDLKKLAGEMLHNSQKDVAGNQIYWSKMRHVKFEKKYAHKMQFRYSFDEEMSELRVAASRKMQNINLEPLYNDLLKISAVKKADLLALCVQNVIPQAYQSYYRALPAEECNAVDAEDFETITEE